MGLPVNATIQFALTPQELPGFVAKQIGCMYLKRYAPEYPGLKAQRGFKSGQWKGCLTWILTDTGKVLGWAIKAVPEGEKSAQVMVFVAPKSRRQGLGDLMLDCCARNGPRVPIIYYPHSPEAKAFYQFREKKLTHRRGI